MIAEREALARDLVKVSYLKGDFVLRSGRRSNRYFDKFLFETEPALLKRLGKHLAEMVPNETQRLAAPELGAVLLGGAVSMETGLPLILVRKEPKGYGTAKQLEGRTEAGDKVTVIEDVVTTGGDSLRSAQVLRDAGADVIHLIVVLDRGEGGEDNIKGAGILSAGDLKAKRAKVSVQGAGQVTVNASDELDAEVSGTGFIWYIGTPKLKSNVNGLGLIQRKPFSS